MNNTLKMTSKLILVAAFAMAFVGCAKNLNGEYTGTETVSQSSGGQTQYGQAAQPLSLRVSLDEASGRVHGTWQSSAPLNPADPASVSIVATGQLSGTRDGDRIVDARLTIYGTNNSFGSVGGFNTYGISAYAAGCGSYSGELSLANDRLYGTLTAGSTGVDPNTGQPIGGYNNCSGTRLIDGTRSR